MADRMVTKNMAKTQTIRVNSSGARMFFWWKSWYGGTMVVPWYLPPTYPLPTPAYPLPTPSLWGGEIVVFPRGFFIFWVRISYTCKKLFFRVNPLFPPLEVGRHLKNKASRLVQKMTKLRTKSSGTIMFTFLEGNIFFMGVYFL